MKVFISSRIGELWDERKVVIEVLHFLGYTPLVSHSPPEYTGPVQEVSELLESSEALVTLFYLSTGRNNDSNGWIVDEFNTFRKKDPFAPVLFLTKTLDKSLSENIKKEIGKQKKEFERYWFRWDRIQNSDETNEDKERLKKYIEKKYKGKIKGLRGVEINKHNDTITVNFKEEKEFSLKLNYGYLFNWSKIPGNENDRLLNFLKQKFGINWIKKSNIEKIDDGRTIKVSAEKNYLLLKLNDENTTVNLEIDDSRTDKFVVKTENGELNIYNRKVSLTSPGEKTEDITTIEDENLYLYTDNVTELEFSNHDELRKCIKKTIEKQQDYWKEKSSSDEKKHHLIRYTGPDFVGLIGIVSQVLFAKKMNIDYISHASRAGKATVYISCSTRAEPPKKLKMDLIDILNVALIDPKKKNMFVYGAFLKKKELFRWDQIPGNDNEKLKGYLFHNYDIDWEKIKGFEKTDEKTIRASYEGLNLKLSKRDNELSKRISKRLTEIDLEVDNEIKDVFIVEENNKIFEKGYNIEVEGEEEFKKHEIKFQYDIDLRVIDTPGQMFELCKVLQERSFNIDNMYLTPTSKEYSGQTALALWVSKHDKSKGHNKSKKEEEKECKEHLNDLESAINNLSGMRVCSIKVYKNPNM